MRSMEHRNINFVRRDVSIFAGAIFISNRETKLECLQRKLFGLPLSKYKFLKHVKVGMILFLFEHEERKLYGVFEATSDGALNIIPDAFRSTGQSYPAQILFKRIWMCKPLCEDEFRSAIEDNYFSPYKFHFGLSYQQVIELIHLFYSRKINIKQHKGHGIPNKIIEKFENTVADEVRLTEKEAYFKCRSDEYSREGKREDRRRLALPQASLDHPMLYKIPATTTSMQHAVADAGLEPNQLNLSPFSHPQNSYSETLYSQRCSICLSHDHIAFHHFSIENQPSTTSEIEYKPLPLRSSSLHVTNDLSPQTQIVQYDCVSGAQPNQVYEFPDYIPLVEESQQKFVSRESQNSSSENSEYIPSAILNSCIPGACKETSKHFYSADGYSDDELKTYQRVEVDEYTAVKSSLYADSDSNRTSVFSRLSRQQKICNHETSPEPSNGEPSMGISLCQFLNILSTRRNFWSAMEVSKQSMECNNSERYGFSNFDHSDGYQNKITQIPIQPVGRSEIDQYEGITDSKHVEFIAALDSELSNDVLSGESFEIPFYNFRRRNMNQKYELKDDSNKSGDICDSEEKLMQSKKRRIVRPSLYEEINQNVNAEAEANISSQKKEKTKVEMMSSHASLEYKKGSKVSAIDRFLDSVVPGLLTVRKYEAVGESLEQNHVTSMDELLDFIPIG